MFDSPTFTRMFSRNPPDDESGEYCSSISNREYLSNEALSGTQKFADLLSWQIVHSAEIEQTKRRAITPDCNRTSGTPSLVSIIHRSFSESNLLDSFDNKDNNNANTKHCKFY